MNSITTPRTEIATVSLGAKSDSEYSDSEDVVCLSFMFYSKYLDTIENNYKTCKENYTIWYTDRYNKILKTLPEFN